MGVTARGLGLCALALLVGWLGWRMLPGQPNGYEPAAGLHEPRSVPHPPSRNAMAP